VEERHVRLCLNWKVLGGVGAAAVAVLLLAPGLAGAVVPLLFVLACPISMLVMMGGMTRGRGASVGSNDRPAQDDRAAVVARLEAEVAQLRAQQEADGARRPRSVETTRAPHASS